MNADQLQRELADLHRDLNTTRQALLDEQATGRNAQVMAEPAHAYCAARQAWRRTGDDRHYVAMQQAGHQMCAAHDATTPSPTQRYVVVAKTVEAWKDRVVALAEVVAQEHGYYSDARAQLRDLINNPPKET